MDFYIRWRPLGAIYVEYSKSFENLPLFMIETCKEETILHLPYLMVILTPAYRLKKEDAAYDAAPFTESGSQHDCDITRRVESR